MTDIGVGLQTEAFRTPGLPATYSPLDKCSLQQESCCRSPGRRLKKGVFRYESGGTVRRYRVEIDREVLRKDWPAKETKVWGSFLDHLG